MTDQPDPNVTNSFETAPTSTVSPEGVVSPGVVGPTSAASRYLLGEEIARGGMGEVYRATDTVLEREIAIKVLQAKYDPTSRTALRFDEEAKITAQLQHPSIPAVHDLGTLPDGRPFLAMKLIKGETLDTLLKSNSASERGRLIAVFEQICQAVAYAHAHNVIHRDLKPANIMVGAFGEVQVMDWGLAKVLSERRDVSPPDGERRDVSPPVDQAATEIKPTRDSEDLLTQAGSILGTPAYMPPEQAIGAIDQIDQQSDVFGLGGLLAAILTGKPPFVGETSENTRQLAALGQVQDCFARLDSSGAEPELVELCKRCLAAEKADRPRDAETVTQAVAKIRLEAEERARQAELDLVKTVEQRKRRRTQVALGLATVVMILVGIFGAVVVSFWQQAEAERVIADQAKNTAIEQQQLADLSKIEAIKASVLAEKAQAAEAIARQQVEAEREKLAVFEYGRTMQVAHQEWRENNIVSMRALLASTNRRYRDWEWYYLNRIADGSIMTLGGHGGEIFCGLFCHNGSQVVTGGIDNTVKLRDVQTGRLIRTFRIEDNPRQANPDQADSVSAIAISPDETQLASGGFDGMVIIWDVQTGERLLTINTHAESTIGSVDFSADGSKLVTSSWSLDKSAKVWNTKTGKQLVSLAGHKDYMTSASFSPDASRIVTTSGDHTAMVWNANTGEAILTLKGHAKYVSSAKYSPDGSRIVTGSGDQTAKVWDANTGVKLFTLRGHTDSVSKVCYSPDGKSILTASNDNTAKRWDASTGEEIMSFKGHQDFVHDACFSPDGSRVFTVSRDGSAKLWDADYPVEMVPLTRGGSESVQFNADSTKIAVAGRNRSVEIWDVLGGTLLFSLRGHQSGVKSAVFNSEGNLLVTTSSDRTIKLWDLQAGQEVWTLPKQPSEVQYATFSPDSSRIVSCCLDKTASVWDTISGNHLFTLRGHTKLVDQCCFSPDGSLILTVSWDQTAKLWDASTGKELRTLSGHSFSYCGSFSPDGLRIVTGSGSTAKVWDTKSGQELFTLKGHTSNVISANFNPGGTRIVTGSGDKTLKLWDASTGAEILTLKGGHTERVHSVYFSSDGKKLLSAGLMDSVNIWDSRPVWETRPSRPGPAGPRR